MLRVSNRKKRIILITGSTDGIGRQTALELAAHHTNFVIIHGRNAKKCEAAIDYIIKENKLENRSNLDYVVADFSDLYEVAKMAEEVEERFPGLNVLLCNAGVLLPKRTESRNGLELTFQVCICFGSSLANTLLLIRRQCLLKENEMVQSVAVQFGALMLKLYSRQE
ncbi:unnamed protein product [Dracunculus medinensis]|uniref:Oxidoreductase, short chain dehydrogenase/reductase family protein n=1 Tax=Dracunculus medinensis TaxID=318479 RepID=A0A3P7SUS8_DRAME|nr:unnamed protein product [Dracunculus medinensis]